MMDKRFSEKEVALVLRRAAEIDATGAAPAQGMTVADIEAVALEAGIGRDAVRRAFSEIGAEGEPASVWWAAPPSRRAALRLERELTHADLQALVQAVEEETGRPGTVSEALGTVRWTASDSGMWTTQVALSAGSGETRISVHERVRDAVRRAFHLLPTFWGGMLGVIPAASLGFPPLALVGAVGMAAVLGHGIGRLLYGWRSRKSRDRVDRLATRLGEVARALPPPTPAPLPSEAPQAAEGAE